LALRRIAELQADRDAAVARAAALEGALRPFAEYAKHLPPIDPDADRFTNAGVAMTTNNGPPVVTFADLRAALRALSATPPAAPTDGGDHG
jgi:hypothetical protein